MFSNKTLWDNKTKIKLSTQEANKCAFLWDDQDHNEWSKSNITWIIGQCFKGNDESTLGKDYGSIVC